MNLKILSEVKYMRCIDLLTKLIELDAEITLGSIAVEEK